MPKTIAEAVNQEIKDLILEFTIASEKTVQDFINPDLKPLITARLNIDNTIRRRKLKENTRVRYSVENTEKGPQAENIRII